jgi:hypothetical protein
VNGYGGFMKRSSGLKGVGSLYFTRFCVNRNYPLKAFRLRFDEKSSSLQ